MKMNTNKIKSVNSYKLSTIFIFALVMFMGLSLLQAIPAMAQEGLNTWYVDGTLGANDGTHGTEPGAGAFKTIQYAINDSRVVAGDTIIVAAGTYNTTTGETFPINVTEAVTIKSSDGAEATILDAGNLTGVYLKAAATLDGFTIKNASSLAICIYDNAKGASAINNVINGASLKIGNNCENITVQDNTIDQGNILVYDVNSGIRIKGNKVSNYTGGVGISLLVGSCSNVTVKDNEVTNCSTGIAQTQGSISDLTIEGNKVSGITTGPGISVYKGSNIKVQGNEVHGCTHATNGRGISITEGSGTITIQGNKVYKNTDGILIGSNTTGTVTVNENSIYGNAGYGLKNNCTSVVDATRNWWGAASGPKHETTNPDSTGDKVSDNVNFTPWCINEAMTELSNEVDIKSYKFEAAKNSGVLSSDIEGTIDKNNHTVTLTVPYGTNVTALVATFTLSDGATAKVGETAQASGTTPNNFTEPVIYTITSLDGTTQNWTVTVTITAASSDATLNNLTIDGTTITGFDPNIYTYTYTLPYGTTTIPTVGATPTDPNATIVITQATSLTGGEAERTATVVVTAQDGTTTLTYKVIFGYIKITMTKTGPATASQGNTITYTITYKNAGLNAAKNVVITETYPPEVEFVEASPAPTTGNNRWTIGTLDPGDEGTITITVRIK